MAVQAAQLSKLRSCPSCATSCTTCPGCASCGVRADVLSAAASGSGHRGLTHTLSSPGISGKFSTQGSKATQELLMLKHIVGTYPLNAHNMWDMRASSA